MVIFGEISDKREANFRSERSEGHPEYEGDKRNELDQLRFQQAFNRHNSSTHPFANNTDEHAIYPCQLLTQGYTLLSYG